MSTSRTSAQLHRDRSLFMSSFYGESDIIIERPARQKWSTSNKRTATKPTKNSSYEDTGDCSETSFMSYGDDTSSSLQVYEIKEVPAASEILPGKQRTKSLAEIYNKHKKKIHERSNQSHFFASDGAIRSRTTVHLSPPSPPSVSSSSSKRIWKTSGAGRTAHVGTPVNKKQPSSSSVSSSMEVSSSRGDRPLKPSEIAKQERTKSLSSLRNFNVSQRNLSTTDRPLFHDESTTSTTTTTTTSSTIVSTSRPAGWSSTHRNWKSVSNLSNTGPKLNLKTKGQGSQKQDEEEERTHAMTVDTEATAASSDAGSSSASSSTASSCSLINNLPDFSQGVPSRRTKTNKNNDPYVRLLVDDLTSAPRWTN